MYVLNDTDLYSQKSLIHIWEMYVYISFSIKTVFINGCFVIFWYKICDSFLLLNLTVKKSGNISDEFDNLFNHICSLGV